MPLSARRLPPYLVVFGEALAPVLAADVRPHFVEVCVAPVLRFLPGVMRSGAAPEEVVHRGVGGERPARYSDCFTRGGVDGFHEGVMGVGYRGG